MDAPVYWRSPFKAMLTSRALVEYVVLDIEPIHGGGGGFHGSSSSGSSGRWSLAEAQVARKSDFGRNDTVFFARTHLGNILHPGMLLEVAAAAPAGPCVTWGLCL
jgi:nonsense-mediated mRNA decay protein 3